MSNRILTVLLTVLLAGCGSRGERETPPEPQPEAPSTTGRLVILGFDGVDPRWLERWAREGKLPNLAALMEADGGAGYRHLASTNPPQSPVAWTTFATGTLPGDHGIYDFVGRRLNASNPRMPVVPFPATTSFEPQRVGPPVATNLRSGIPFWKSLADDGVPVLALNVPYSFPPDPMREGRMLSGLGVPDLRETNSTFTYVGTDVTEESARRPPGGGSLVPLRMEGGVGRFELEGPTVLGEGSARSRMRLPVTVRIGAPEGGATLTVGDREIVLVPQQLSDFVELRFQQGDRVVQGIARFALLEAGAATRLFVSPISIHPRAPFSPITYPDAFAAHLADALGHLYKTVGWDHDTSALNSELVDDALFLADMESIETDRRAMLESALEDDSWKMLIWVSTSTDRVAHMFYRLIDPEHPRYDAALAARHGDAIEREYRRMDETIGRVLPKLRPDDTLLVLSDHGFHNYRRGLHLNQWLRQQGLLTLKDGAESGPEFLLNVDWSRTKAYALGTGQIYLNRRDREPQGIVSSTEADAILAQIRAGLLAIRDEEKGGAQVIDAIYLARDVFQGRRAGDAPDIQVAFAENYRTSWETILGGVPAGLFADNPRKWSGDHAASDVEDTPGILVSNRRVEAQAGIVDLAPTAFAFFGRQAPAHYQGRSLLVREE